ncbi:universal stress protein [Microbacterium paraoxydans]|uniref:universal stress protein n=1 Tax=Microbacterium paraoxydans TaxID=199592 RepID=UPI001CF9EABD|nr:universal stress protein [Microbacterium paraoxydans]
MIVVVGIDPARRSASAVHLARLLAGSVKGDLVVAAVLPATWGPVAGSVDAEWRRYTHDAANLALDYAAAVLGDTIEAQFLVHEAQSARGGLLEVAEQYKTDFIVLGSGSGGAPGRVAIGADGDAILHASKVPVAVAPRGFRAGPGAFVGRITGAVQVAPVEVELVRDMASLAARWNVEFRLASFAVVPRDSGTSGAGLDAGERIADEWSKGSISRLSELLATVSGSARVEKPVVGRGPTWESAVANIGWRKDELLVLGSSERGPISQVFLGSRGAKITRSTPVPVIVLPQPHGRSSF